MGLHNFIFLFFFIYIYPTLGDCIFRPKQLSSRWFSLLCHFTRENIAKCSQCSLLCLFKSYKGENLRTPRFMWKRKGFKFCDFISAQFMLFIYMEWAYFFLLGRKMANHLAFCFSQHKMFKNEEKICIYCQMFLENFSLPKNRDIISCKFRVSPPYPYICPSWTRSKYSMMLIEHYIFISL